MGSIGGELAHLGKGALQPAEHFVEGISQPVQLVVRSRILQPVAWS